MIWPALIAHADWGTDPRKRQVAVARSTRGDGDGHASYVVESLAPATDGRWFGLLAMIAVVTGALDAGVPADDPAVLSTEGWILGRAADRPALRP